MDEDGSVRSAASTSGEKRQRFKLKVKRREQPRSAASLVLKLAVRMVRVPHQAILSPDLIVFRLSLHLPLLSALSDLLSPPGKPLLLSVRPCAAAPAAAAAAADADADQDGPGHHGQSDDQGLKVQPTDPPAGLGERAERGRGQQPGYRVLGAVIGSKAPQALSMRNAAVTVPEGGTQDWWRGGCLALGLANQANEQQHGSTARSSGERSSAVRAGHGHGGRYRHTTGLRSCS